MKERRNADNSERKQKPTEKEREKETRLLKTTERKNLLKKKVYNKTY